MSCPRMKYLESVPINAPCIPALNDGCLDLAWQIRPLSPEMVGWIKRLSPEVSEGRI